jgi:hypothetical protein
MATKPISEARRLRIADEFLRLQVRPWQYCPSEICDGPCPFGPDDPEWDRVAAQRLEIRATDPSYFNGARGTVLYKYRHSMAGARASGRPGAVRICP